ncbi:YrdB family protein [Streptomyces mangrovisoli]|uniref:DUF2568 domain-containing protein n=1 Tax=Streptomyces mangrovisoli TaxID=1428628 RepID=A0A1J4NUQ1_9ACTN|nr:YrdB family protein [Streptomyces mangrovisoli]OIJ66225.1 hypothetical protein WN71_019475 [Streptomyces mangrovisoli]
MKTAQGVNLGVLFLIELGALAAVAYWGFTLDAPTAVRWLLMVAAPAVLVALWARWGAAKAPHKVRGAGRVAFETVWFGAGAAALFAAGATGWAVAFAAVVAVSKALAVVWHQ